MKYQKVKDQIKDIDNGITFPIAPGNRHYNECVLALLTLGLVEVDAGYNITKFMPDGVNLIAEVLPTQAEKNEVLNSPIKNELLQIDIDSIRSIREWIASQPSAPQGLIDNEATAAAKRALLK
jgi:hypothetical protein